ncbi:MAG: PAS domain S-box protein [Ignavibacteria bacterium]|nr:PAS domain S-box protein [Ignavibacteria bacterium]
MNGVRAKLFIVEDEAIVAMDIRKRLQSVGYEVLGVASEANTLFLQLKKGLPDIILMDIMLKGDIDGIRAARQVKELYNIPVIFITAHVDDDTFQRAKITEPYGYIVKPIDFKDLFNTIEIALYRHQMEKALLLSELKYRTLIFTATDSVLTLDENGLITSINPKTIDLFQYDEEEILGKSIKTLMPDTFVNHLERGAKRFLNLGRPLLSDHLELDARKKDGALFPVEISFSQWHVENDRFFTLIIRDITARKQAELELVAAKSQLEKQVEERTTELTALIDESPLAIRIYDPTGRLNYQNAVAKKILFPFLGLQENTEITIYSDPYIAHYKLWDKVDALLSEGGTFSTMPLFFDAPRFEENLVDDRIFLFRYYALQDTSGRILSIVNIVEDLTEYYKAKEFSRELIEKRTLASGIFSKLEDERLRISSELHDSVGQILSAAKFTLEVFERTQRESFPSITKAKSLITSAGTELRNIIYSIHPVVIPVDKFFEAIESLLSQFSKTTQIEVYWEKEVQNEEFVEEFRFHVYRMVQEAINNIAKHSEATQITIRFGEDDENLYIQISDNGKGFDMNSKSGKGPTYGLMNMKQRAELFEGTFAFTSESGKGTIINFSFPNVMIYEQNSANTGR